MSVVEVFGKITKATVTEGIQGLETLGFPVLFTHE